MLLFFLCSFIDLNYTYSHNSRQSQEIVCLNHVWPQHHKILQVYTFNLAQLIFDKYQIQNQWNYEKCKAEIYYIMYHVMWTFFPSETAVGLRIIHPNRFKMHMEPETLLLGCRITQCILAIVLEFTCAPIYIIVTGKGGGGVFILSVWHNKQCATWTRKTIRSYPCKYILQTCNMRKQSASLHLMEAQRETRSCST